MITFLESMPPRISRENGRAVHPLSGRKVSEYEARDIRRRPPRPPRMKFRRMDFSRAECFETTAMGKSISARRLNSFGDCHHSNPYTFLSRLPYYPFYYPLLRVLPFFMLAPQSTGTSSQTFNISFGLKVPKDPANHIPAYARASSLQIAERKFSRKLS